jgi:hypothetical protein
MNNSKLIDIATKYIETLSLEDYLTLKSKGHHLQSKVQGDVLFYFLRDILSEEKYKFRRDAITNNDEELKRLCRNKISVYNRHILDIAKENKQQEKYVRENARIERYNSFPFYRVNTGNDWFNFKVKNVEEIFPEQVHGDWPKWEKLRMQAGNKTQIVTLSSGEEFIVTWSKQALGIKTFDIIDFTTEDDSCYIKKNTILGNSNCPVSRPLSVNVDVLGKEVLVNFYTVKSAHETLQPEYAYSTICAKTKGHKSQKDIDNAFKGFAASGVNICGIYRHGITTVC